MKRARKATALILAAGVVLGSAATTIPAEGTSTAFARTSDMKAASLTAISRTAAYIKKVSGFVASTVTGTPIEDEEETDSEVLTEDTENEDTSASADERAEEERADDGQTATSNETADTTADANVSSSAAAEQQPVEEAPAPVQESAPAPAATGQIATGDVGTVIALVNEERAKAGLAPLSNEAKIQSAANIRASEQQAAYGHTRPNGSDCFTVLGETGIGWFSNVGENVAFGQHSAQEVVTAWMNSPVHRANILNGAFQYIGVGHYIGSNGTDYWVQMFITY